MVHIGIQGVIIELDQLGADADTEDHEPVGVQDIADAAGSPAGFVFHEIDELQGRGYAEPPDPVGPGEEIVGQAEVGAQVHGGCAEGEGRRKEGEEGNRSVDRAVARVVAQQENAEEYFEAPDQEERIADDLVVGHVLPRGRQARCPAMLLHGLLQL